MKTERPTNGWPLNGGRQLPRARRKALPKKTSSHAEGAKPGPGFLIVGVGASAGGLEAFTELLTHLPLDLGMGFVLVQHLDPARPSALTELLSKTTHLPVREVREGTRVEPNAIYVIPPNARLSIVRGVLSLDARGERAESNRAIDSFFESLAQDQGQCAIGIILSGTATDGTMGLEAIKAEGGIAFAQDGSAKYDSMPRSAVAAGCVDFVLSPEGMAKELTRIARHPLVTTPHRRQAEAASEAQPSGSLLKIAEGGTAKAGDIESFKRILALLKKHGGVDFSLYRTGTLERRIRRRMILSRHEDLRGYAEFLQGNSDELRKLYCDVLIGVTNFFRNPEAFEVLKTSVFSELARRGTEDVRMWVLGCSSGQEAYSLVMAYTEACDGIPNPPELQLFATDLNEAPLEKARAGLYAESVVGALSPERLKRFFTPEEGGYRVSKALRDKVIFARQNVLSDPPFSRLDLISCRNMLIYIDAEPQKRVLPLLHYALKPEGFLFLGASESIGSFGELFEAVDKKQKIFRKRTVTARPFGEQPSATPPRKAPKGAIRKALPSKLPPNHEVNVEREADRVVLNLFAPAGVLVNSELQVLQFRGDTSRYLKPPSGQASFHLLKMAREGLMHPLRAVMIEAEKSKKRLRRTGAHLQENGKSVAVTVEVLPLRNLKEPYYLIFFEPTQARGRGLLKATPPETRQASSEPESSRMARLTEDLTDTRDYLQSVQEQSESAKEELQAANEEVTSANEELQSINEELETSKEEMESANEELTTVNEELNSRNLELARLNSDMVNLQASTRLSVVLLGRDLLIRRFSPLAEKELNLLPGDLGRPIGHVRHNLDMPDLVEFVSDVIDNVREQEREVRDHDGVWYMLRARPYISTENKVEGAVLVLINIDQLKRTQNEIAQARDYAQAIVDTARDPFLILDADLRVESGNTAFYRTFKVNAAQSVGKLLFELDHGHWDIPQLRRLLEEIVPQNEVFNDFGVTHDFEHIGQRTMVLNARKLETGRGARILLGIQDLTQERLAAKQLEEKAELLDLSHEAVIVRDDQDRITFWNKGAEKLYGWPREEALGRIQHQFLRTEFPMPRKEILAELERSGQFTGEVAQHDKSGRRFTALCRWALERTTGSILTTYTDIEQRKQAENLARYQNALLQAIIESVPEGILVVGPEGEVRHFNKRFVKIWRMPRQVLEKKSDQAALEWAAQQTARPEEFLEGVKKIYRDDSAREVRHEVMMKDGRIYDCSGAAVKLRDEKFGWVWTFHNITERKKMEEQLRKAGELLKDHAAHLEMQVRERTADLTETVHELESFSYSVSHDLRAPLRAMNNYATFLSDLYKEKLDEQGNSYLHRISSAAGRLDLLIRDVLNYTQLIRAEVKLAPVDLDKLTREILGTYPDWQAPKAQVTLDGQLSCVLGHEGFLTQSIANLLSNAMKFVEAGVEPQIRIRGEAGKRPDTYRLWIEDNGIGIAA
ncbi:MAG TPA: chemotaxis protein CheB, partial [Candidatus Saccharimonadales bacterium]|nr:chemotaxis protein CheB [Candidatus Saccharimonadales bacterium]